MMKHFRIPVAIALVLVLTLTALPLAASAAASTTRYYSTPYDGRVVNVSTVVHLRSTPYAPAGYTANIIGKYTNGTALRVLGYDDSNGSWFYVSIGGKTGYMYAIYVNRTSTTTTTTTTTTTGTVPEGYARVAASSVNIRYSASTNSQVVGSAPRNAQVRLLGATERNGAYTWYRINYGGIIGWIRGDLLVLSSGTTTTTTPTTPTAPTTSTFSVTPGYVTVKASAATIRSAASTASSRVGAAPRGASVYLTGTATRVAGYVWYAVNYGGAIGWIRGDLLVLGTITTTTTTTTTTTPEYGTEYPQLANRSATVAASRVNIRLHPGIGSQVVDKASKGDSIWLTDKNTELNGYIWCYVYHSGMYGWMRSDCFTVN